MRQILLVGTAGVLLAACATAPQRSDQVDQAKAEIATLASDPLAQQAAEHDLEAARKSLQEAEDALEQRQPPTIVDNFAYVARRHAEAGEARISAARSRQEMAKAQDERNRILLEARNREAQNAQAQAASAQAQLEQTQQQLADLQAKQTERGMVLTLGDVLFDTGQATLKPGAQLTIGRLAKFLNAHPQTKIIVEGHTDSVGSEEYNEALSERRAQSVANALVALGVDADQLRTIARGKDYPVATNATAAGRQQNRRVEIVFSDSSGRFAQQANEPIRR